MRAETFVAALAFGLDSFGDAFYSAALRRCEQHNAASAAPKRLTQIPSYTAVRPGDSDKRKEGAGILAPFCCPPSAPFHFIPSCAAED
jgi:hypothetical protein